MKHEKAPTAPESKGVMTISYMAMFFNKIVKDNDPALVYRYD